MARQFDVMSEANSAGEFARAAGSDPAARRFAAQAWQARRRLGVSGVSLRYARGGEVADRADGSTTVLARVRWASTASSPWGHAAAAETPVRFRAVPHGGRFSIVGASAAGKQPLPPWLAGSVQVASVSGASVVTIDGGSGRFDVRPLVRTAVRAVSREWPAAGHLCVIVPHTRVDTAALLGDTASGVSQLAAVTTGLGRRGGSAAAVVINPVQWATMDRTAQQVVMTHEAVHAMTGTIGRQVDKLVAEGFADYVALRDDRRPLSVTAGQILRQVRATGAPAQLPDGRDFDESSGGLGAVYESAWMFFRMLGDQYGNDAVVGFYRSVLTGTPVGDAASRSFGTGLAPLTAAWRAYLTKSASTAS